MGRPVKWRRIGQLPNVRHFSADGSSGIKQAEENILLIEELEAIRLKDHEGLEQEACAEQMQVSRATFQRILINARHKIADSLIQGKGISIAGGNFTQNICRVQCLACGAKWDESYEKITVSKDQLTCPDCQSTRISCLPSNDKPGPRRGGFCQGRCRQQGEQGSRSRNRRGAGDGENNGPG